MKTLFLFLITLFIGFSCGFLYMQNVEQAEQIETLQSKQHLYERGLIEIVNFLEKEYDKK